jgi:hypothetical protein
MFSGSRREKGAGYGETSTFAHSFSWDFSSTIPGITVSDEFSLFIFFHPVFLVVIKMFLFSFTHYINKP